MSFPLIYTLSASTRKIYGPLRGLQIQSVQFLINTSIREHPIWMRLSPLLHMVTNTLFPISFAVSFYPLSIQLSRLVEHLHWAGRIPFALCFFVIVHLIHTFNTAFYPLPYKHKLFLPYNVRAGNCKIYPHW